MAKKSKCCICAGGKFELAECKPINSSEKILLLQCAECGTIFGSLDQYSTGVILAKIARKLKIKI
ncbi:MAG: hypothetical protein IPM51_06590 [Sphingobacteriaceae bacterium]|nr:hypothetical protein [Sphingobacteriaceae bacterium]